ncbi:MAG: cytochrome P450 [Rhodococcus sp. (in: high G+C Gram-positive bacteria)]|uniref:cytochrome P450 n=1 Tax=Rhodococcus sp. TaxID=1831 RepID=UPI003BB12A8B
MDIISSSTIGAVDDRFDLLTKQAIEDPHAFFARAAAQGPVVWSEAHKAWLINDYPHVVEAFRDTENLSSDRLTPLHERLTPERKAMLAGAFDILRGWMVFYDAPRHHALRNPVRRAFTPRMIQRLQPRIEALVADLLDDLDDVPAFDFKERFAFPLPAIVISELLDIPASDRDRFRDWSNDLSAIVFGASNHPDQDRVAGQGAANFIDYFSWLVAERKANPGEDLVSALVAAQATDSEESLSDLDILGASTLLLFGGHETTTNFMTNAMLHLLRLPEQAALMRDRPEIVDTAIDELLRFEGPVKVMVRSAATTHERGGQTIKAGQTVFMSVAGANRDSGVFSDPHRLDLLRDEAAHISFGQGPHHCLGSALAKLEARIALPAVLRRFPHLIEGEGPIEWEQQILVRAMKALPVENRDR